jgi:hypothetical protein
MLLFLAALTSVRLRELNQGLRLFYVARSAKSLAIATHVKVFWRFSLLIAITRWKSAKEVRGAQHRTIQHFVMTVTPAESGKVDNSAVIPSR